MVPQVLIFMPAFNAAAYIRESLESLFTQTYEHIKIYIIDDGSTDGTDALIRQTIAHAGNNAQEVRLVSQPNRGAVGTLNRGLDELAAGAFPQAEFIALMHADDEALPERIASQVAHFQARPEVDILGAGIETFGGPAPRVWRYPKDPEFIGPSLLFWCCFAHPTMMFRRRVVEAGLRYDPAFPMPCEDYALWVQASRRFVMSNVPEVLLRYREHPQQGGVLNRDKTRGLVRDIQRQQLVDLGIGAGDAEMALHTRFAEGTFPENQNDLRQFLKDGRNWLYQIWQTNVEVKRYNRFALPIILGARWAAACTHAAGILGDEAWASFWSLGLSEYVDRAQPKFQHIPPRPRAV